jgi:hypothetical protein
LLRFALAEIGELAGKEDMVMTRGLAGTIRRPRNIMTGLRNAKRAVFVSDA